MPTHHHVPLPGPGSLGQGPPLKPNTQAFLGMPDVAVDEHRVVSKPQETHARPLHLQERDVVPGAPDVVLLVAPVVEGLVERVAGLPAGPERLDEAADGLGALLEGAELGTKSDAGVLNVEVLGVLAHDRLHLGRQEAGVLPADEERSPRLELAFETKSHKFISSILR